MIHNLLDRMKLPFRKNKEFLSVLYDILGFYPHNVEIYRIAFSHKSLSYHADSNGGKDRRDRRREKRPRSENTSKPLNNERLEYLGDAVLETVVSDILFRHFENKREGFLTSTRSKIVQRESLNRLAEQMGLEALIQAAQGTRMSHTNIGGNAFEALMGAIYLDRGFKYCHWFITHRVVGAYIDLDTVAQKEVNFKSKLLEWCQKNRINTDFRDSGGADGERGFRSTIVLEGITVGKGSGRSKKESQQVASKDALSRMRREQKLYDSIFRAKEKRTAMEADESFALPKIDEADDIVIKGKGKDKPVLEDENGRRKKFASEADDYQDTSDAAYNEAYGENPKYEVIDDPDNESEYSEYATSIQPDDEEEEVLTAPAKEPAAPKKDKAPSNKDKAKAPQAKAEGEEPARAPQTKAERKRERNRTAKTIDDAVKGSKKVKAETPAVAEPQPETAKAQAAAENGEANVADDKPLSESAKRRQRRKARREAMAADEANPFVDLDKARHVDAAEEKATASADETVLPSAIEESAPSTGADDELETVELRVAPEAEEEPTPVEAELGMEETEQQPAAVESSETEEQESFSEAQMPEPAAEEESESAQNEEPHAESEPKRNAGEEPNAAENFKPEVSAEAEPIEADADDIEAEEEHVFSEPSTGEETSAYEPADAAEPNEADSEDAAAEYTDDASFDDDANASSEPYALDDSATRPRLRHISLDDFVFGATDATLYDRNEESAPNAEEVSDESDERRQRNSRSRRRKPSRAPKADEQTAEAEGQSAQDASKAQPRKAAKAARNAEGKKGDNKAKKSSAEADEEAQIRANREKAAKRRAQQRRRRRRENNRGDNPSAED